jgi:hypothetical protein
MTKEQKMRLWIQQFIATMPIKEEGDVRRLRLRPGVSIEDAENDWAELQKSINDLVLKLDVPISG